MIRFEAFKKSLEESSPPGELSEALKALWWDGKDDWHRAHEIAQEFHGAGGAWIHAYLHRKEGDNWNANYWYRQAGQKMSKKSLPEEWEEIIRELLDSL